METILEDLKEILTKLVGGFSRADVGELLRSVENLGKSEDEKLQAPVADETDAEKIARLEALLASKDEPAAPAPTVPVSESSASPYSSLTTEE
jgi:hypothetical protein